MTPLACTLPRLCKFFPKASVSSASQFSVSLSSDEHSEFNINMKYETTVKMFSQSKSK